jgi:hypothetical protein
MKPSNRDKSCLHLIVQSSREAVDNCRSHFVEGDVVLFLDDGVLHIANPAFSVRRSFAGDESAPLASALPKDGAWDAAVCFSAVDLEARGVSGLAHAAGIAVLTDAKMSELIQSQPFCLTWK